MSYRLKKLIFLKKLFILILSSFLLFSSISFAVARLENQDKNFKLEDKYQPYFELGGIKYFNQYTKGAGVYDLFLPLIQKENRLIFTALRIFDRTGSSFEGNVHIGYRKLYPVTKQLFGIYGAFDRKRSSFDNNFNQLTLGLEYWSDRWFVGGNVYKPIFVVKKRILEQFSGVPSHMQQVSKSLSVTADVNHQVYCERALPGIDAEVGYSITDWFTSYVGGYYFHASDASTVAGPKMRLTYNYNKPYGRILGIIDAINLEAGVQHDKPRRTTAYIGIKLKVGLTNLEKPSNLSGFEKHMVDLVRRDPDIVISDPSPNNNHMVEEDVFEGDDNGLLKLVSGEDKAHLLERFNAILTEELIKKARLLGYSNDESLLLVLYKRKGILSDISRKKLFSIQHHPDIAHKYGKNENNFNDIMQSFNDLKAIFSSDITASEWKFKTVMKHYSFYEAHNTLIPTNTSNNSYVKESNLVKTNAHNNRAVKKINHFNNYRKSKINFTNLKHTHLKKIPDDVLIVCDAISKRSILLSKYKFDYGMDFVFTQEGDSYLYLFKKLPTSNFLVSTFNKEQSVVSTIDELYMVLPSNIKDSQIFPLNKELYTKIGTDINNLNIVNKRWSFSTFLHSSRSKFLPKDNEVTAASEPSNSVKIMNVIKSTSKDLNITNYLKQYEKSFDDYFPIRYTIWDWRLNDVEHFTKILSKNNFQEIQDYNFHEEDFWRYALLNSFTYGYYYFPVAISAAMLAIKSDIIKATNIFYCYIFSNIAYRTLEWALDDIVNLFGLDKRLYEYWKTRIYDVQIIGNYFNVAKEFNLFSSTKIEQNMELQTEPSISTVHLKQNIDYLSTVYSFSIDSSPSIKKDKHKVRSNALSTSAFREDRPYKNKEKNYRSDPMSDNKSPFVMRKDIRLFPHESDQLSDTSDMLTYSVLLNFERNIYFSQSFLSDKKSQYNSNDVTNNFLDTFQRKLSGIKLDKTLSIVQSSLDYAQQASMQTNQLLDLVDQYIHNLDKNITILEQEQAADVSANTKIDDEQKLGKNKNSYTESLLQKENISQHLKDNADVLSKLDDEIKQLTQCITALGNEYSETFSKAEDIRAEGQSLVNKEWDLLTQLYHDDSNVNDEIKDDLTTATQQYIDTVIDNTIPQKEIQYIKENYPHILDEALFEIKNKKRYLKDKEQIFSDFVRKQERIYKEIDNQRNEVKKRSMAHDEQELLLNEKIHQIEHSINSLKKIIIKKNAEKEKRVKLISMLEESQKNLENDINQYLQTDSKNRGGNKNQEHLIEKKPVTEITDSLRRQMDVKSHIYTNYRKALLEYKNSIGEHISLNEKLLEATNILSSNTIAFSNGQDQTMNERLFLNVRENFFNCLHTVEEISLNLYTLELAGFKGYQTVSRDMQKLMYQIIDSEQTSINNIKKTQLILQDDYNKLFVDL